MNTQGTLHYVVPAGHKPVNYLYPPPEGEPWNNCDFAATPVPICDARRLGNTSIHREGFGLWDAPSAPRAALAAKTSSPQAWAVFTTITPRPAGSADWSWSSAW